ncbi:McrB family protein [Roseiflexus castenholzii]|uniref:McrB family protein n=1 Tax=Roseiflexus castenholzii TaxID=120962 RepID=UPI003C7E6AF7
MAISTVSDRVMFTPEALAALTVPGVAERWNAIQERLQPVLAAYAARLSAEASRRFPRIWNLYEIGYRSQRSINRGHGVRDPIDDYYLVIDRPPRGAGVYLAVSGAERLILVAIQVARRRKDDLARVWEESRALWLPLVERIHEVRFANRERASDPAALWIDRYLANRAASSLLAGFAYRWDDPQVFQPAFIERVIEDALALLPLNEALMERAEAREPTGAAWLREQRVAYLTAEEPPIEVIIERIRARGLTVSEQIIRAYHVALRTRPLVILPGISGAGKTRLTRLYADALVGDHLAPGQENERYLLVAVQPDWHSARDLLGYYNAITGKYHPTPFLRFLQRAATDPTARYFVCLDEMNLARPEYYLAPILSAMETDDRLIDLGAPATTVETVAGEVLTNPFRLPSNVSIIGTVNVDESAHALSDKLLDRANVIEMTDVDLEGFRTAYPGAINDAIWKVIVQVHGIVARAGQPFGYRVLSEMLRYIEQSQGILTPEQALDFQIKQKVLPKLRGDDAPRLRRALTELLELLLGAPQSIWKRAAQVATEAVAAAPFPESAEKVRRMLERLDVDGFTDFYG